MNSPLRILFRILPRGLQLRLTLLVIALLGLLVILIGLLSSERSVLLFFPGVIAIVVIAMFKLAPVINNKPISMTLIVQMVMLTTGAIIMLYSRVKPLAM